MLFVDGAHQSSRWRQDLRGNSPQLVVCVSVLIRKGKGKGWTDLVHKDKDSLLSRQLNSLSNHIDELSNSQVLNRSHQGGWMSWKDMRVETRRGLRAYGWDEVLLLVDGRDVCYVYEMG